MIELRDLSEEDLLTACIWAEARGEPIEGQEAVCSVILNRVKKRMAGSIRAAILKLRQFSWTSPTDPNYSAVLDIVKCKTRDHNFHPSASWATAKRISVDALVGVLADHTDNADHYLNVEATRMIRGGTLPKWAEDGIKAGKVTVVIGRHTFLNLLG